MVTPTDPPQRFNRLKLAVDRYTGTIVFVRWDTYNTPIPTISDELQIIPYLGHYPTSLQIENCMQHKHERGTIVYNPDSFNSLTSIEQSRLHTLHTKYTILLFINTNVTMMRNTYEKNITLQEAVYESKFQQAKKFRELNYNTSSPNEFPLVKQYSEIEAMSMKQAADIIIFKREERDRVLEKSEFVRLYCNKRILSATSCQEVLETWEQLKTEIFFPAIYKITMLKG